MKIGDFVKDIKAFDYDEVLQIIEMDYNKLMKLKIVLSSNNYILNKEIYVSPSRIELITDLEELNNINKRIIFQ